MGTNQHWHIWQRAGCLYFYNFLCLQFLLKRTKNLLCFSLVKIRRFVEIITKLFHCLGTNQHWHIWQRAGCLYFYYFLFLKFMLKGPRIFSVSRCWRSKDSWKKLAHYAIVKPEKKITPVRIVFNFAAFSRDTLSMSIGKKDQTFQMIHSGSCFD